MTCVSGTVRLATILLTDLVGSTHLASTVGPTRWDALRDEHFLVLREAIESSRGREIKSTGDGLMVAFDSASAAVRCARLMQQLLERRYRHSGQRLHARIGLGAGECTVQDGEYFGMPSIEAARLCDKAPSDGILVSPVVKMLAGRSEDVHFASVGELDLKGIADPMEAFAVSWQPLDDESGGQVGRRPLPPELRSVPRISYVGRPAERARIERMRAAVRSGQRHVIFVSGEPGIGKTRLAAYAAHGAHAEGFDVLWGGCSEELAMPYEPWIEACSHLVKHAPQELLDRYVEHYGGEVGRLAPNLQRRVPRAPAPQPSDPETERFLLFAAVAGLLRAVCDSLALCLVLDDLQYADGQTIALLKYVARTVTDAPLMVIVTYRDSDVTKDHPLSGALADLHHFEGVERLALAGLGSADVVKMMSDTTGHELDQDGVALATRIATQTGGNPFFVGEILRSLVESKTLSFDAATGRWTTDRGARIRLPQSVRDVIERRVNRLGEAALHLLSRAAVLGNSFDVELLCELVDVSEGVVLDRLEAAVEAALLVESSDRIGRFTFVHGLINQCLYEGLGATRRAKLHHRVALALESLEAGHDDRRLGELALHWRLATAPEASRKAAEYARRAGQHALASLAPAEAIRLFRDAVELSGVAGTIERCESLIGLGEAQRQTGDPAYRRTLLEASAIAYRLNNAQLAADAALANSSGMYSAIGEVDEARLQAIRAAIEIDDPSLPARRALLLALQALELGWDRDIERRRALADEAVSLARTAGDVRVLASVLRYAALACTSPDTLELRSAIATELAQTAKRAQDPALEFWADVVDFNVMVEKLDAGGAESALQRMDARASVLGQPLLTWNAAYSRAGWALPRGHLTAAEQSAEHAFQLGQHAGEPNAAVIYGSQLACLRSYQGRAEEVVGVLEQSVANYPDVAGWRAGLASCYCLTGRRAQAAAIVERAARDGFAHVYWDQGRSTALALYADAAYECKLRGAAAALYDLIEPWRDQMAWNGGSMFGHGAMWLGLLAATLGWDDRAEAHLDAACTVQEENGVLLWAARAYLGWAETLGRRGDAARASQKASRALELAQKHGYGAFEPRAAAIVAGSSPAGVHIAGQHESMPTP